MTDLVGFAGHGDRRGLSGSEVLTARSGAEVAGQVRQLAADTPLAGRIGRAVRARVLAQHTYAHRVAQVEAALAEAGSAAPLLTFTD